MTAPSFPEFYRAVHGRDPLPWQARLAETVQRNGWPAEISVPTGLGKTTTIDIAVWSLMAQADRPAAERTVPTRIWYVVNRRLLVDAASDHAERLALLLAEPHAAFDDLDRSGAIDTAQLAERRTVLARASDALSQVCPLPVTFSTADGRTISGPLYVSRLRGGAAPGRRPPHPAVPAVLCSTVPMFGSRLLFRSYGSSNRMWPVDAALAGTDSLVLLDEAHIAGPLQRLVRLLPDCDSNRSGILRPPGSWSAQQGPLRLLPASRAYPTLVSLTATGHAAPAERFDLDDDDHAHPLVRRRIDAAKAGRLVKATAKALPEVLAANLLDEIEAIEPQCGTDIAAVVYVNAPATARAVRERLRVLSGKRSKKTDVIVLTGQLRDPDADEVRSRLLDRPGNVRAGRSTRREQPLVVIATQTLEVGADVDFDIAVSELADVRAIVQRLGRLNRLGDRNHARAVLVEVTDCKPGGLYGDEPAAIAARLALLEEPFPLGPGQVSATIGDPAEQPLSVPELLPTHMWEFAKTSSPPVGAAPPEPFFSGFADADFSVAVCWRAHDLADGAILDPAPSDLEFVDVPLHELRDRGKCWRVRRDSGAALERVDGEALRPGDRVVLAANDGGYGDAGWDPAQRNPVHDLSPLLRDTVQLSAIALQNLYGRELDADERAELAELRLGGEDQPDPERDEAIGRAVLARIVGTPCPAGGNARLWERLGDARFVAVRRSGADLGAHLEWTIPTAPHTHPRVDAFDELSVADELLEADKRQLVPHLGWVGDLAARFAELIGLAPETVDLLRDAGRYHDLGKADVRFQLLLGANSELLAKSVLRRGGDWQRQIERSGWPRGARHELLSVQLLDHDRPAAADDHEATLLRHLMITHHGHGRPLVPTSAPAPMTTTIDAWGVSVRDACTDPGRADWLQPDRFRRLSEQYGYWGLALLEALLRQADHVASNASEVI